MQIKILFFGLLTEITGTSLTMDDISDTNSLIKKLNDEYPALQQLNFTIAVDQKIITGNTVLNDGCIVALMPPFSGG
jgi:sulfur-carrier protein